MRIGTIAQHAADRAEALHTVFMGVVEGSVMKEIVEAGQAVSLALNDWCRVCQIPLPPRPKSDGRTALVDISSFEPPSDESAIVESLRSKPAQAAAPAQPSPTPEATPSPVVDVDQTINPG